jgi:molybdopterin converting factor subunit 1
MKVRVLLFARARELAGRGVVEVDVPAGASVAQLREWLGQEIPPLANFARRCAVAVGGEYALDADVVPEGAEVALIPPVSGGQGCQGSRKRTAATNLSNWTGSE